MQYLLLFFEGIMAFLSPCHLPLLPAFVSFFAAGEGGRRRALLNSLGFVTGFTIVFVILGAFAGTVGALIHEYIGIINLIAGTIIVILGLDFLGIIHLKFLGHVHNQIDTERKRNFFSALAFGVIFSVSWTPCAGAFIVSALAMASAEGGIFSGISMLLSFSLGLGMPYILSALLIDKLKRTFDFIRSHQKIINLVSGILLILIGILIASGLMEVFLSGFGWHDHH